MKTEVILAMVDNCEAHAQQTESGIEYWLARDLQHLLGYEDWRNFVAVIGKAKTACELSGHIPADHFVNVNKMVYVCQDRAKENRRAPISARWHA